MNTSQIPRTLALSVASIYVASIARILVSIGSIVGRVATYPSTAHAVSGVTGISQRPIAGAIFW
jgi:hypothetical protein